MNEDSAKSSAAASPPAQVIREALNTGLVCVISTTLFALLIGQDVNWDQRNYHFYSVYAWFSGTTHYHIAPGQIQSWLNPLGYLPQYLAIRYLPPVFAGGLMGAAAGLNGGLLYAAARLVTEGPLWYVRTVGILCVCVGFSGPLFISETGTTLIDNILSMNILAALVLVLASDRYQIRGQSRVAIYGGAGLLLGVACGLKPTTTIFALSMGLSLSLFWWTFRLGPYPVLAFGAAGIVGFLLAGGYWMLVLWREYQNPLFPFFNSIFHSSFLEMANRRDARFLPATSWDALSYPFQWLIGRSPSSELPFRDARFSVLAILFVLAAVSLASRNFALRATVLTVRPAVGLFLLLFFFMSYAVWIALFAIHRYFVPIELAAGLMIFVCVDHLAHSYRSKTIVFSILTVFIMAVSDPPNWGRIPYGRDWYGIDLNWRPKPATLYVMVGNGEPFSYVIPFMPESRFVRLYGNLKLDPIRGLGARAKSAIKTHNGALRTLTVTPLTENDRQYLERFGVRADERECVVFASRVDQFHSCRAIKLPL